MFFQKLLPLLLTTKSLHITMEADKDDKITLSVVPKYKDDNIKLPPIVMSGTVQELDAGFAEAFGKIEENIGVFTNIDMFMKQAKQLEKEQKGKATPKTPVKTETPKGESDKEKSDELEKEEGDNTSTDKTATTRGRKSKAATVKEEPKKVEIAGDLFNTPDVGSNVPEVVKDEPKVETLPPAEPLKEAIPATIVEPVQPVQQPSVQPTVQPAAPTNTVADDPDEIF